MAAVGTFLSPVGRDSFFKARDALATRLRAAAAAVSAAGGTGAPPEDMVPVMGQAVESIVKMLPGTLLLLQDGSWAMVPVNRGVIVRDGNDVRATVAMAIGGRAAEWSSAKLDSDVQGAVMGVLTVGAKAGSAASTLTVAGMPASVQIEKDAAGSDAISHVALNVEGSAAENVTIPEALRRLGLEVRPWMGGRREAALFEACGVPRLAAAKTATISSSALLGGGPMVNMSIAKLEMLGMTTAGLSSSASVPGLDAAILSAGLAGIEGITDAITAALATARGGVDAARARASPEEAAHADEVVTASEAARAALGALIDLMPPELLAAAVARLTSMVAAGLTIADGGCGAVVARVAADMLAAEPAAATSPSAEMARLRAEVALLRGGAAPITPTPRVRFAPVGLTGFEALRPAWRGALGGVALSNLAILTGVGGEQVMARLASMTQSDPIVIMAGPGSLGTGDEAAALFGDLLEEARRAHSGTFEYTEAPVDLDEAGARLRNVMRAVKAARGAGVVPTPGGGGGGQAAGPPQGAATGGKSSSLTKLVKTVKEGASADQLARACSAAIVEPMCNDATAIKAAAISALDDPLAEARRMIDLLGAGARSFIVSTGETDVECAGELPRAVHRARTGLLVWAQRQAEEPATLLRVAAVGPETLLLRSDLACLHLDFKRIVVRWGGSKPMSGVWQAARTLHATVQGTWGNPLEFEHCKLAAKEFGPVLRALMVDGLGLDPPLDPTVGLAPFLQQTVALTGAARVALAQEAFDLLSAQWRAIRCDPMAPLPDAEAIFLRAATTGVKPIADSAASAEAGAAAGLAAADKATAALLAEVKELRALIGKRPAPISPLKPGVVLGATQPSKRAEKRAKKAAAEAAAGTAVVPATAAAAAAAALATTAAATAKLQTALVTAQPVVATAVVQPKSGTATTTPAPNSISCKIDRKGGGLVEVFDAMALEAFPGTQRDSLPCGWAATWGHKPGQTACAKCASGAQLSLQYLSRLKAACTADLLKTLPAGSPVAKA